MITVQSFLLTLAFVVGTSACGEPRVQIPRWDGKVWVGDSTTGTIRRNQDQKFISCTDREFQGHLCMSGPDFISFYDTFVLGCRKWKADVEMMKTRELIRQQKDAARQVRRILKGKNASELHEESEELDAASS